MLKDACTNKERIMRHFKVTEFYFLSDVLTNAEGLCVIYLITIRARAFV